MRRYLKRKTLLNETIFRVLSAAQAPMHYKDIYAELVKLKVYVSGWDPARNVGAHLSLDDRFENVGSGMWQIAIPCKHRWAVWIDEEFHTITQEEVFCGKCGLTG